MQIDNDLILQWEPKIMKMIRNTYIAGMDREDIAQELRIALTKAAKKYDESKGAIFHTYLHTSLVNTIDYITIASASITIKIILLIFFFE